MNPFKPGSMLYEAYESKENGTETKDFLSHLSPVEKAVLRKEIGYFFEGIWDQILPPLLILVMARETVTDQLIPVWEQIIAAYEETTDER